MIQFLNRKISPALLVLFLILPAGLFARMPDTGAKTGTDIVNTAPDDTSATGSDNAPGEPDDPKATTTINNGHPFESFEFLLSIAVLIFGLIVVGFEVYLGHTKVIDADHIFKCIILTLVITCSIVLITAGYSNNQITPVVGILGSIAGYMLGKSMPDSRQKKEDKNNSENNQKPKTNENA